MAMKTRKKMRALVLGLSMIFMACAAYANTITLSTFYPSPYGSYQNLDTTSDTYLATDGGKVGIGTKTPRELLEVNGNVIVNGTITARWVNTTGSPLENPSSPDDASSETAPRDSAGGVVPVEALNELREAIVSLQEDNADLRQRLKAIEKRS